MTPRERLFNLFENKPIDKVLVWLLYPYHKIGCYVDVYENKKYLPITSKIDDYCVTFDRRNYNHGFFYNGNKDIVYEEIDEPNKKGHRIKYLDLCFENYIIENENGKVIKKMALDIEDLQKMISIPYEMPTPSFENYAREKEELGDRGMMMIDIGDALTPIYNAMSAQDFSIMAYTRKDETVEILKEINRRTLKVYEYFLKNDIGEVFFIVGSEFAGPPLLPPSYFKPIVVDFLKEIVDLIREYKKYSIVHYHGFLKDVLDDFKRINPDGLHTIEAPPVGNTTLKEAREKLGNMILIGNLQYEDIRSESKENIENQVKDAIKQAEGGRFILSPTAGPFEENPTDKMIENYLTMIRACEKYGKY